jgi:V/A-type H+-transporting ATPase subunit C
MAAIELGLVARAKGLSTRLLSRETLDALAEAGDLDAFVRGLARLTPQVDARRESADVFAIERVVGRMADRHLHTLLRWQERTPGVLDVFAARQDRRSLRALLRGAAQGAPSASRLDGLLPTPALSQRTLTRLAHQPSPADVVRQLVVLRHPDADRLLPLVQAAHADLLAVDVVLLVGCAERATQAAVDTDDTARDFVRTLIDFGNAQNALLLAADPQDIDPAQMFVPGGRWISLKAFTAVASRKGRFAGPFPFVSSLPAVQGDAVHFDRLFVAAMLDRLTRAARADPLSTAPLLRVLLLIEAQVRDLRALAWGTMLGTPISLRRQQLLTPS